MYTSAFASPIYCFELHTISHYTHTLSLPSLALKSLQISVVTSENKLETLPTKKLAGIDWTERDPESSLDCLM